MKKHSANKSAFIRFGFCLTPARRDNSLTHAINLLSKGAFAFLLFLSHACLCAATEEKSSLAKLALPASVSWGNAPLGESIGRLSEASGLPIMLDRRVDPTRRVTFQANNLALGSLLTDSSSKLGLGVVRLGPVVYLGPTSATTLLPRLQAQAELLVKELPRVRRRYFQETITLNWERLATPRDLIEQASSASASKKAAINTEAIPHDLWPAGELRSVSRADALTLLLIGFDLTWEPTRRGIKIIPIRPESLPAISPEQSLIANGPSPTNQAQRYTLRVTNQPFGAVLNQLAARVGYEVSYGAVSESLRSRRVSFSVTQVSFEELLSELGNAAGVQISLESNIVVVRPR